MPGLINSVRDAFSGIEDRRRQGSCRYSLPDTLVSAMAMFSLKYPSLLRFDDEARDVEGTVRHNLSTLFGVEQAPSDTQMRSILDPVEPQALRPAFHAIHAALQRGGSIEAFHALDGRLLVAIDGTGTFASTRVSCPSCCVKRHRRGAKNADQSDVGATGDAGERQRPETEEYHHQLLAAALVHPDRTTALMLDFEPIVKGDGAAKNDSERAAAKRLLPSLRQQYPKRRMCVLEDALAANGPHLRTLIENSMDYLIVAKEGSVPTLFELLDKRFAAGDVEEWESMALPVGKPDPDTALRDTIAHGFRVTRGVPFGTGRANAGLVVHSIEAWEVHTIKGVEHERRRGHWITNLEITRTNACALVAAARTRWKIENECFNCLKNQGYSLGHNFGHGEQYLSSTLGGLALLAFLIDQVQESFCRVFAEVRGAVRTRAQLWERLRNGFLMVEAPDWRALLGFCKQPRGARFVLAPSG